MYLNSRGEIPDVKGKITFKKVKGTHYVYCEYARVYNPEKKYNTPKRSCIGKLCDDDDGIMMPYANFLRYFLEVVLPDEAPRQKRSSLLRVGAFLVIRKIISDLSLDVLSSRTVGKDFGLFLDLAAYSIVTEGNAAQYYPDYAYHHPLMTEDMKIYSDSKVSDFLSEERNDQKRWKSLMRRSATL